MIQARLAARRRPRRQRGHGFFSSLNPINAIKKAVNLGKQVYNAGKKLNTGIKNATGFDAVKTARGQLGVGRKRRRAGAAARRRQLGYGRKRVARRFAYTGADGAVPKLNY